jgi:hypothetical protein
VSGTTNYVVKFSSASTVATGSIFDNGNIGIGTTTTSLKLNVSGSIYMAGGNGSAISWASDISSQFLKYDSGIDGMILSSWNNTTFYTQQTERVRINSTGNLGIGTTSPGTKLEVVGSIRGGSFPISTTNTGEAWFGRGSDRALGSYTLQLGGSSAAGTWFEMIDRAWSKVIFAVSGEAPTTSFYLTSTGNVGIGTSSPGVKLDVIGGVRSFSSAGNYGLITNGSFQAVGDHGGTFMLDLDNTGAADLVNIKKSGTSRFYIKNDGNIGIGTTSPSALLHVSGSSTSLGGLFNGRLFVGTTTGVGQDFVSVRFNSGGSYSQAINIVDSINILLSFLCTIFLFRIKSRRTFLMKIGILPIHMTTLLIIRFPISTFKCLALAV